MFSALWRDPSPALRPQAAYLPGDKRPMRLRRFFPVLSACAVIGLSACSAATPAAPVPTTDTAGEQAAPSAAMPAEISVPEAKAMQDSGAFMLDVREQSEWNEMHMPGATHIPLGELAGRVDELPQDKPVVVVCRSGNRSREGREILKQAGFTNVASMAGGMKDWQAQGLPTVSGP